MMNGTHSTTEQFGAPSAQNADGLTKAPSTLEGRFIVHVEDEPKVYSCREDDIGVAVQQCYDLIGERLLCNGCGDGLVLDRLTGRIVTVLGMIGGGTSLGVGPMPLPAGEKLAEMRMLVHLWDQEGRGDADPIPFVWNTFGG